MYEGSAITFPCALPIRVMGRASPGFARMALDLVARHAPDLDESTVSRSRAGRYLSIALIVQARSRAQLDAIYRDPSGHDQIAFVL